MIFVKTYAQEQITISGIVFDKEKQPIANVGVTSRSNAKTQTDPNGKFSLKAVKGEPITFSSIGYITLSKNAQTEMVVELVKDDIILEEVNVVGVGYGTMRKSDLTGAITSVSAKDLRKGVITSAEQLLQGKVAGLSVVQASGDPTQGSSLRLRGGTSLTASNSPLIVVDGVPGVDMNAIQPNDIISIDVLKDASAAAIYGSRGANGVIIVTTNREGGGGSMSYNGYVAIGKTARNLDLLSASQWRDYVAKNNITNAVDYGSDTDWQKALERTAISNSHSLSFSDENAKSGFRGSLSYLNSEGVIKTSSLNRLAANLTGYKYGLNNRLKLETSIYANRDNYHPIDIGIYEPAYNLNPTLPIRQPDGSFTQIGVAANNNPLELLESPSNDQSRKRLLGYLKAELDIVDGLKGIVNTSYEYNSQQGRYYLPSYSFNGQNTKGTGNRSLSDYTNTQIETYLTYDKTFNQIHKFNAMGGYSFLKNVYEGFGSSRSGFDSDAFGYNNLGAGNDFRIGDVYSYKGESKLISFFGRVNYVLLDRYMFTGTLRRDGSSRFGENHKWGLFPSASAAWRISEESFMSASRNWLNNLKFRVGYGVTGNQDGIGEYKSLELMGTGGGAYYDPLTNKWKQSYSIAQNANPNLKWESTAQTNVGLDISFLNRFNLTLDAYIKKTSDLLYTYDVPQPPYLYDKMLANVGNLSNKGIEVTFGANLVKSSDFNWNLNLVMARNKQIVDKLSNDIYQTDAIYSGSLHGLVGMSGVYSQILKEGYAVGTFWGPKFLGFDSEGKHILEKDKDGNIINQDLGNAQPKLTLGFATDLSYRNFDFNVSLNGMFGQKILNAQAMNISAPGRLPSYNVLNSWLDNAAIVKDGPIFSDYWIESGNFLRLQSATLGYTVPVNKKWFSKMRVYVTGENLFTLTKYKGMDPEVNISGLKSPGIDKSIGQPENGDNYYYPRSRTVSFGLNLSF